MVVGVERGLFLPRCFGIVLGVEYIGFEEGGIVDVEVARFEVVGYSCIELGCGLKIGVSMKKVLGGLIVEAYLQEPLSSCLLRNLRILC